MVDKKYLRLVSDHLDNLINTDPKSLWDDLRSRGYITVNEARRCLELEPILDGDIFGFGGEK